MAQLLDDNSHNTPSAPPAVPRVWYLWHAVMITALLVFIVLMVFGILPFFPDFIAEPLNELLLPVLMFGMCGITFYTYYKGFKWNWLWSFFGASFTFIFCFAVVMSNIKELELYLQDFLMLFSSDKDFSTFAILGLCYNILIVPCTEIMMVLEWGIRKWSGR